MGELTVHLVGRVLLLRDALPETFFFVYGHELGVPYPVVPAFWFGEPSLLLMFLQFANRGSICAFSELRGGAGN